MTIRSLRKKIVLVLAAVLAFFLVAGAIFIRPSVLEYHKNASWTLQSEAAAQAARTIEFAFDSAAEEIKTLSWLDDVRSMDHKALTDVLVKEAWISDFFDAFFVTDRKGKYVVSTAHPDREGSAVYAREMLWASKAIEERRTVFINLDTDVKGITVRGFATPIYGESKDAITGALVGVSRMTPESKSIQAAQESAKAPARVLIVGEDSQPVATISSNSPASPPDRIPTSLAHNGSHGPVVYEAAGQMWLAAYRPVQGYPWGVVVEQPFGVIEAKARYTSLKIITSAVILFVIIGIAQGALISRALKPMTELVNTMRDRFQMPQDDQPAPDDDLVHSTAQLDTMYRKLDDTNAMLEARVAERTRELGETNELLKSLLRDLKLSEERLSLVSSNSGIAVWETDAAGTITYISQDILGISGYSSTELTGRSVIDAFMPNAGAAAKDSARSAFSRGNTIREAVRTMRHRDGRTMHVEINALPRVSGVGEITGFQGSIRDITPRVLLERQIAATLREREMLLREIHHRVKNNLQVISSLISLQSRTLGDAPSRDALATVQNRLRAMALVHEEIYNSGSLDRVRFDSYASDLCAFLARSLNQKTMTSFEVNTLPIAMDINTLVCCGLIINELVSNSLTHGLGEREQGVISLKLEKRENDFFALIISDNGSGTEMDLTGEEFEGLGMKLVRALAEQIGGTTAAVSGPGGTTVTVLFPNPALPV